MQNIQWDRPVARYVGIACAYAVIYALLHAVYISHWELTVGFRLACLILIPPRYWPALLVGEAAAIGKTAYDCANQLGLHWAVAFPFMSMIMTMLAVYPFKRYWPVVTAQKMVSIPALLFCFLAVTIASTFSQIWLYALMQGQPAALTWPSKLDFFASLWFIGTGLGIYMIVPLALWAYSDSDVSPRDIPVRIVRSPLLLEALAFLLPCLYVLAHAIENAHSTPLRHLAQIVMLLSPAWLALRHGWKGASLGCMLANLSVVLSMPALYDPATLQTQTLMLISSTAWIVLGSYVTSTRVRPQRP